ncbi:PREDICTED: suppressor protein SRP40 isoform X2 [Theobroma cacao]|uniref:Suppressor protein SRP40 isoform X2 n=1 Tax=Theobroma cacao TaxID=3641 RepID=A0AB32V2D1_THECC|nr:PREDICTED: suppressor protein SRP40 isoform X2 [Theobroma cacao]
MIDLSLTSHSFLLLLISSVSFFLATLLVPSCTKVYVLVGMNRSSSSSKPHNHKNWSESEVPKTKAMKKRKEKQGSRRAFQHVKNTATSSSSSSNLSSSSSGSIEAPRGCLRFLLSHSSSSASTTNIKTPFNRNCPTTAHLISKTPKSAPISRPPHSKPFPFINQNSSSKLGRVKKSQSSKKPTSETPPFLDSNNAAPETESLSVSQDLLKLPEEELQFTPVAVRLVNRSSVSKLSSPAEASMHWLLSPCHEDDDDDKENSAPLHGLLEPKTLPYPSSPLSDLGLSLDLCSFSNNTSDTSNSSCNKCQRSTNNMLISTQLPHFQVCLDSLSDYALVSSSPNDTPYSRAVPLKEEAKYCYNIEGGCSPFSTDTLGSENVMQTPTSDSSLERHAGMSCSSAKDHKRYHFHSDQLLSVAGDLGTESLSPKRRVSIWDTTSSSFQFDRLTTPSNSMELPPFQKILGDQSLWTSNSTFENVSQSQMRISWREGLVSRIFEMDELDSCRCLSDEEEELNVNSGDPLKPCQSLEINVDVGNVPTLKNGFGSTEFVHGESREKLQSPVQGSCAESISTDGGALARSEDSDWSLCYKNNLFEV